MHSVLYVPVQFHVHLIFIFGFLQAATGYAAVIFYNQEHFVINEENYKNIGSDPTRLVVFFSRMGYVRKRHLKKPTAREPQSMK